MSAIERKIPAKINYDIARIMKRKILFQYLSFQDSPMTLFLYPNFVRFPVFVTGSGAGGGGFSALESTK